MRPASTSTAMSTAVTLSAGSRATTSAVQTFVATSTSRVLPSYNDGVLHAGSFAPRAAGYGTTLRVVRFHPKRPHRQRRTAPITCELERLPRRTLRRVVPQRPTVAACVGQTAEGIRIADSIFLTIVVWFVSYFASRTLLVAFSTSGMIAWRTSWFIVLGRAVLPPLWKTFERSAEVWGNRGVRHRTRGALFTGRVTKTGYALASEVSDHRTHFQMLVEDEEGRELLYDVPQLPAYRRVLQGMRCEVVVLSRSKGFSELTGVTEAYLPELDLFVGRYSLLNRRAFWRLLQARDERERREGGRKRDGRSHRRETSTNARNPAVREYRGRLNEPRQGLGGWGGVKEEEQASRRPQSLRKRNSTSARKRAAMVGDW